MDLQFTLTITVNFSDGTEQDDLELEGTYTADEIGDAVWRTAAAYAKITNSEVTSIVIVAVIT